MSHTLALAAAGSFILAGRAVAHEHHSDDIPEGERISPDPIVNLLIQYSSI